MVDHARLRDCRSFYRHKSLFKTSNNTCQAVKLTPILWAKLVPWALKPKSILSEPCSCPIFPARSIITMIHGADLHSLDCPQSLVSPPKIPYHPSTYEVLSQSMGGMDNTRKPSQNQLRMLGTHNTSPVHREEPNYYRKVLILPSPVTFYLFYFFMQ